MEKQTEETFFCLDYAEVLQRLVPPRSVAIAGPVYDPVDFLRERFGEPERAAVSELLSDLTFRDREVGVCVRIDNASSRVVGITSFAFGLPFLWKSCAQSRWSGAWIVGTGAASYTPIIGSFVQACAQAAGLAMLDYGIQIAAQEPALCAGLCSAPCWCRVDAKFPTRNTTITTARTLFGIPVSFTVTITLSGWVIASCEGWNL